MNQIKLSNISDEIIDFDDEYSENENYPEEQTPDMSLKQKDKMNQKDQVQGTPEDDEEQEQEQ